MPGRVEVVRQSFTFGATGVEATEPNQNINQNGFIKKMVVTVPNFFSGPTVQVTITDNISGIALYTSATLANHATTESDVQSSTETFEMDVPVTYGFTCDATLSKDAGGSGGIVLIQLYVKT